MVASKTALVDCLVSTLSRCQRVIASINNDYWIPMHAHAIKSATDSMSRMP
jgi:hypothetical protein